MRMTVEDDSEHVPHFALVPVGGGPDVRDAGQRKAVLRQGHLDAHIFVPVKGKEMIDDREIAGRLAVAMHPHALIDGGEVVQHLVGPIDLFFEKAEQGRRRDPWPPKTWVCDRRSPEATAAGPSRSANFLRDGRGLRSYLVRLPQHGGFLPRWAASDRAWTAEALEPSPAGPPPSSAAAVRFPRLLQQQQPFQESFRTRRAAGHINIHGKKLVHALDHAVDVVHAAGVGAGAHRNHPARLHHLFVKPLNDGRHLE